MNVTIDISNSIISIIIIIVINVVIYKTFIKSVFEGDKIGYVVCFLLSLLVWFLLYSIYTLFSHTNFQFQW